LASRYAAIALSRNGHGDAADQNAFDAQFLAAVTNPEKVARIIARSFYKDLRKAGFETKQILVVATELIDSLNQALRRTKAKTASAAAAEAGAAIAPAFKALR
jgi:L-methionine (R)-S-oxide reductase